MNLAYFPLSLLLPCDAFLTASLASLIYALIATGLTCADRGLLGSGTAPAFKGLKYRHKAIALSTYHVGDCSRSKCDGIKILNVKPFVVFIIVWRAIIRNIRKFAPIQNFPLYGITNVHCICAVFQQHSTSLCYYTSQS